MDVNNVAPIINLEDAEAVAKELYKRNLALYKERKRTEELLYRVSEAIFATDEQCKVTLFNHTLEKALQKKREDVIGKNISDVLIITDENSRKIDITKFCTRERGKNFNIPSVAILKTPKKNMFVHIKVSIIESEEGATEFLITMSDVTEEKELEKVKDEFISITSHELRTPMSIIKSYLWMLQSEKGGNLNDKQKSYVKKAVVGTERMIALINDMLSVSRIEEGRIEFKKEKILIKNYLIELIEELEVKTREKNLYLNTEIDENIQYIFANSQKLSEILINLVGNAVKFTQTGGITIKVENLPDAHKISVIDTGQGIQKTDLKMLFHKFQRLDSSYKNVAESGGTGLGLYIVKLYVERMGGTVGAISDGKNTGSTFWISLPKPTKD